MKISKLFITLLCIIMISMITGCISINRSDKRPIEPKKLEISDTITLESTGTVNMNIPLLLDHVDFFPAGFKINSYDKVIYIDPIIVDSNEQADYILITHSHDDHFSLGDIEKLSKKETIIIGPIDVARKLNRKLPELNVYDVKPKDKVIFDDITIEVVAAYNIKSGLLTPHPMRKMWVGYVITLGDVKLYHAGDTDYVPEIDEISNIDIAMIPIGGDNLTMNAEDAALLVNNLKPKIVIPMHYSIETDQINIFRKLVNNDTKVIILDGINEEF